MLLWRLCPHDGLDLVGSIRHSGREQFRAGLSDHDIIFHKECVAVDGRLRLEGDSRSPPKWLGGQPFIRGQGVYEEGVQILAF